jgi:ABC-type multidrug transport system permease subunit
VVSTAFINLCTVVAISRDEGILKRIRGTPMPPWVYLGSRIGSAVWFSLIAALIQVVAGILLFGVRVVWPLAPAALVTLLLGISCFCALGLALAAVIPNGETAPAVANFTAMPILFVSGVFFPLDDAPGWLRWIGDAFPVKHFNDALQDDFNPFTTGSGFDWAHLAVLLAWALVGTVVAVRFFQWEPRGAIRPRR